MNTRTPAIQDHLTALADATRGRILLLLERQELTVTELCSVLQLPQSTVSRHLKALGDAGWVSARAEGTSNLYAMTRGGASRSHRGENGDDHDAGARRLWALVREQTAITAAAIQDQRRLQSTLAARKTKSQEFFSSSAGQWDRMREELFGSHFHLAALAALADGAWIVGDLGCGTGQVTAALAPFVSRVVAVDESAAMLQAAKQRLRELPNVDLRRGELEALPLDDGRLDAATMMVVLHHLADPSKALAEAARVLRPGGRLLIVDMLPHDREHYRQQMGHVRLGFGEAEIVRLLTDAGFGETRVMPLPPDPKAKGPGLFVAGGKLRS
jgi:ArsR family transcriptional regulator